MSRVAYVDASALVKLVHAEPFSAPFYRWWLEAEGIVTSRIGTIEMARAVQRRPHDAEALGLVLRRLTVLELDEAIARVAAAIEPPGIRTLDAIHLATGLSLLPELDAFVTYDDRLADAARAVGLPVVRPA